MKAEWKNVMNTPWKQNGNWIIQNENKLKQKWKHKNQKETTWKQNEFKVNTKSNGMTKNEYRMSTEWKQNVYKMET